MSARYWAVAIVCLVLLVAGLQAGEVKSEVPKVINVVVAEEGESLRFTVSNTSNRILRISRNVLPWGDRYSVRIVAVQQTMDEGRVLADRQPISDLPPGPLIVIPPGKSVSGLINLQERFPTLRDARGYTDILLFWYYGFCPDRCPHGKNVQPFSGTLTLKRSSR
jgi:hypothetical protein